MSFKCFNRLFSPHPFIVHHSIHWSLTFSLLQDAFTELVLIQATGSFPLWAAVHGSQSLCREIAKIQLIHCASPHFWNALLTSCGKTHSPGLPVGRQPCTLLLLLVLPPPEFLLRVLAHQSPGVEPTHLHEIPSFGDRSSCPVFLAAASLTCISRLRLFFRLPLTRHRRLNSFQALQSLSQTKCHHLSTYTSFFP